jgi:hypothetical protein
MKIFAVCLVLASISHTEATMTNIFQHPNTVSGVAVENGVIATACFDGYMRVIEPTGHLIYAEPRAAQLYSVAIRDGLVATDTDAYSGRDPVAIASDGTVVRSGDFSATVRMTGISKSGNWAVGQDLQCRHRLTQHAFIATPTVNALSWPMAVEEAPDGTLVIAGLDGWVRRYTTAGTLLAATFLDPNGVTSVDVATDGRILCVDFTGSVYLLSPGLSVVSQAKLPSLGYSCRFYEESAVIGVHSGALVKWDLAPDAAPVATAIEPKKGKRK